MVIERTLRASLKKLASLYPVVTVTGPRQSGKTTLCRSCFPDLEYVSLEPLDFREDARLDPRGFLEEHRRGVIIDEVQHVPELLSYIQTEVDERRRPGRFILTGSQHLGLLASVTQSLAGRTAVLHLLPPSLKELARFPDAPTALLDVLWTGAYPAIQDQRIPADRWYRDYVTTYVQRDVSQVLEIGNLRTFGTFLRLCAGRTGQVLNLSSLGSDAGISHNTAKSWLSVLETGFLTHRLPPWHRNLKKRMTKTPKLHLFDSGLACYLLRIRSPQELRYHPLRGAIFESWVVSEVLKARYHNGLEEDTFFFRDHKGLEIDLVLERGDADVLVEVKSGATVSSDAIANLQRVEALMEAAAGPAAKKVLVYGGSRHTTRNGVNILPWSQVQDFDWVGP
ncbi:MAG: ATP-binding protein [bacterium]